jgi:hypothetical protein
MACAAVTNSSSRYESTLPRTSLASTGQESSEKMAMMPRKTPNGGHSTGMATLSAMKSGSVGKESRSSMMRCVMVSNQPP